MTYEPEVAIAGIIVLEALAIYRGIDGTTLAGVIAVLGPIAGYKIGVRRKGG